MRANTYTHVFMMYYHYWVHMGAYMDAHRVGWFHAGQGKLVLYRLYSNSFPPPHKRGERGKQRKRSRTLRSLVNRQGKRGERVRKTRRENPR